MSTDLLLSYYGDDLTGSTDVMESLTLHGVPTVLFLKPPSPEQRARFAECRAIGLAGTSRSESPQWMEQHLPTAFTWLKSLNADFCHYKVCSTFDSAPQVGSIGKALDIGHRLFDQPLTPVVVGAPQLKRYTAFGHLFATVNGTTYRLDRHPVMSRHPVTPMADSDLRVHLGKQTDKQIALADLVALGSADVDACIDRLMAGPDEVLLYDVPDVTIQREVGRQLCRTRKAGGQFVVGSSGVEYALVKAWAEQGVIPGQSDFTSPGAVDRIAVVSGSCSQVTARQIACAEKNGFATIALDPRRLVLDGERESALQEAVEQGLAALRNGLSVVLYTAKGPDSNLVAKEEMSEAFRHRIGEFLGKILKQLIEQEQLQRAVIAGGDTSSHALQQLGIFALTARLPLTESPGSPLCTAYSENPAFDGLQIALKGGQIGTDAYFSSIRDGIR
ncbi:four-carbon acid sugar kinase family protein [Pseudomonas lalucatii]|uniref:Four-carbon acid sugar kinase family protein n=1 Tax=Pseudomonas lalucatii TaxID=1424203 RepID=A0ABS5Q6T0_9PSED|nr:four-carbon acid sugar kinase family protein [Pseudomonas lalucatii]MBS7664446.1 four-carbon acid sugar kinase family protein [Pseudomonas lalucatii]